MPDIYFETSETQSVYRIDEASQQILIYLASYGATSLQGLVESVEADSKQELKTRIAECLGPESSGLVTPSPGGQQTIDGEHTTTLYGLTDTGERFVSNHKSRLSMPADFKELADTVHEIRLGLGRARDKSYTMDEELHEQLDDLYQRLEEIESRLSNYK